jgi:hypothetical protein
MLFFLDKYIYLFSIGYIYIYIYLYIQEVFRVNINKRIGLFVIVFLIDYENNSKKVMRYRFSLDMI